MTWSESNIIDERLKFVARMLESEKMAEARKKRIKYHSIPYFCGRRRNPMSLASSRLSAEALTKAGTYQILKRFGYTIDFFKQGD